MATLSQLRGGLAARLGTITSLKGVYKESPGQVETPGAVIRSGSPFIIYGTSVADGSHDYTFSVLLLVSIAQGAPSQEVLDPYLDPTGTDSVVAAIEADSDLGGVCDSAAVTQVVNAGLVSWAGVDYLGAELLVSVLA
jgi:hypothetical protein